jgi:hypothetical protein
MAARRGNSTSYHRSDRTDEEMWRRSVSRDPLCVAYDRGRAAIFANESINGGDVADALDFLAEMIGDHAFRTAALALRGYGLAGGGLKQDTLRLVREQNGTAAWAAMPCIHSWKQVIKSERAAAAQTAVQLGIPGSSFEAVKKELCKTYPVWLKEIEDKAPTRQSQSGDTGRKLRVRFTVPWLGADN